MWQHLPVPWFTPYIAWWIVSHFLVAELDDTEDILRPSAGHGGFETSWGASFWLPPDISTGGALGGRNGTSPTNMGLALLAIWPHDLAISQQEG
jgi:hypothetical protein